MDLTFHHLANIFPLMSESELTTLTADIEANGQIEPIWTFNAEIIDGRNRYLACQQLDIEPKCLEWQGDTDKLLAFIISLNLHRRHLNESQRAMVAAKLANIPLGSNQYNGSLNLDTQISLQESANLLNISRANVANAKKVLCRLFFYHCQS